MRKIYLFIIALLLLPVVYGQCITTEDANNTPSSCKRESVGRVDSRVPPAAVKEADKWLTTIYNSVIEPAIKKTKGLRGSWSGGVNINKAEQTFYSFFAVLAELGCTTDKTLFTKNESGIELNFRINSLEDIAEVCVHYEYKWISNNKTEEKKILETVNGRQLYLLRQPTETEKYAKYAYYRKEDNDKYLVIAKPGIPLFMPVSIKDVLLITKSNYVAQMNYYMQGYDNTLNQTFEDYLAERDFASFQKSHSAAEVEKARASYKSGYDSGQKEAKRRKENNTQQTYVNNIDNYLQQASSAQLAKPCIGSGFSQLGEKPITNDLFFDNPNDGLQYVTINPAYAAYKTSLVPQFVMMATRINGPNAKNAVSLSQKKIFEDNFDFKKLEDLLVK